MIYGKMILKNEKIMNVYNEFEQIIEWFHKHPQGSKTALIMGLKRSLLDFYIVFSDIKFSEKEILQMKEYFTRKYEELWYFLTGKINEKKFIEIILKKENFPIREHRPNKNNSGIKLKLIKNY